MTNAKLSYVGPLAEEPVRPKRPRDVLQRLPLGFMLVVALPTLVAAIYFLLIASPRYVSEARFVVRAPSQLQPSSLGVALQGVGLAPTQTDAFAVHEYIMSSDGVRDLDRRLGLERIFSRPGVDAFSRYPRFGETKSADALGKAVNRFVTVGYNSQTGISTLRVEAFSPRDAQAMATAMLDSGEQLVNRLNDRSSRDTLAAAQVRRESAQVALSDAQTALSSFRNREQFIDPERTAQEGGELIGGLLSTIAGLKAERAQLQTSAPQSPQLPILDSRIRAYEAQVAAERAKIVGASGSLAPRIGTYEALLLRQEIAAKEFAEASVAVTAAELDARRQKLYLERIAAPNLPDVDTQPRRLRSILTVLVTSLLIYGVGWLIWASVREHRHA